MGQSYRKTESLSESYHLSLEELRCPIFVYGDAIFALPEAFFFGYSGAIFEQSKVSFH